MFWNNFPYSDVHNINLDWIIKTVKMLFNSAVFSINGHTPDADGNVQMTGTELGAVGTVNGKSPDSNGDVEVGTVRTINNQSPDANGAIYVGTVRTVNGFSPDAQGEVKAGTVRSVNGKSPTSVPTPGSITLVASDVGAIPNTVDPVESVNGLTPDANGNVNVGTVKSVNNTSPDANGNVNLPTVAGVTSVCGIGPDGNGDVSLGPTDVGAVATVNGVSPDSSGEVTLTPGDIGAVASASSSGTVTWDSTNTDTTYTGIASDYVVVNKVCYVYLRFKATTNLYDAMILATGLPAPKTGTPGYMTATTTVSPSNTVRVRVNASGQLTMYYAGVLNANDTVMLNSCYPTN